MILLNRGSANTVNISLSDLSTIENPVYLFEFISGQKNVSYTFLAADISLFPERYNRFLITETTSPDNLNGEVELDHLGLYDYSVYEQTSTTNLDVNLATKLLQSGKMRLEATSVRINDTYEIYIPVDTGNIIYDPSAPGACGIGCMVIETTNIVA